MCLLRDGYVPGTGVLGATGGNSPCLLGEDLLVTNTDIVGKVTRGRSVGESLGRSPNWSPGSENTSPPPTFVSP